MGVQVIDFPWPGISYTEFFSVSLEDRQSEECRLTALSVDTVNGLLVSEIGGTSADATGSNPILSVVAPCYNEAAALPELYRRVTTVCRATIGQDYEIVFVNDGSHDNTLATMALLAEQDSHVVVVNLTRNYGHQIALSAGLDNCHGDRILIIDADLQDPPELLPKMMSLMDEGADVIYGQRRTRKGIPRWKKMAMRVYYRILRRLVDIDIPLDTGDFRLITRRVLDVLKMMPEQNRFIRGMISWTGLTQVPIVYDRDPRYAGQSSYPFRKLMGLALDGITGFSIVPLRLASYFGIFTGFIGLSMLIYSIGGWLFVDVPVGWASQITIILILGSGQLIVLGIVGEYLGRLYLESKRRPIYLVESIVRHSTDGATKLAAGRLRTAGRNDDTSDRGQAG